MSVYSKCLEFHLISVQNITNEGLQTVAYKCRSLKTLYIANCPKVSSDFLHTIVLYCTSLYIDRLMMRESGS